MTDDKLLSLAVDAYTYAFPLVIMDASRRQATNVADDRAVAGRAPANQFAHFREYPLADAKDVVRFNFDTLYSMAWLDLRDEPIVLTAPDAPNRYHLVPILDMWTDVIAVPGTRTTGGEGGSFVIAHSSWDGVVPDGTRLIRSGTPHVWVLGRTQANGAADYPTVHAIQNQFRVTPLSAWGTDYVPPSAVRTDPSVDDITPPQTQVWNLDGREFFARFADLLAENTPHGNDYPMLFRMEQLGIRPGEPFTPDDTLVKLLDEATKLAQANIVSAITDGLLATERNGWQWMQTGSGAYGTSYRLRAMVALAGLGANLPEDALYPNRDIDDVGDKLLGTNDYVLHFENGELPPADAFWSLTLYDNNGFQVANPIERFALGDRDDLVFNTDGSLDLLIQHTSPSPDRAPNWLPSPEGEFQLTLRIYSPRAEVFREGLSLPAPTRALS